MDRIRSQIRRLYETDPNIHLNVTISHPKTAVRNAPAVIKGVYRNLFLIQESDFGYPRYHSIQYAEVMIGQVEIPELGNIQPVNNTVK